MSNNPIVATIPFTEDGKHHGHLRLPYSRDDSAWGHLMLPITVVRNGNGPTALLTGANHGDEYEGPIALHDLALNLTADKVHGTVIIVPALNHPALLSGTRTSPLDGANMNRIFPGRPDGSVSEKIAHYFHHTLVPMADVVLDFHSGGKTIEFVPFAASHVLDNKKQEALCETAAKAFNAPYYLKMLEIDNVGMYDTDVEQQGKVFVTTELGSGGTATPATIYIAKRGIHNLLAHANILQQPLPQQNSVELHMPDDDCFIFSTDKGMLEPVATLGQPVSKGETVAKIWQLDHNGCKPVTYVALRDGLLIGRHFPGLIQTGDFVALIATKY